MIYIMSLYNGLKEAAMFMIRPFSKFKWDYWLLFAILIGSLLILGLSCGLFIRGRQLDYKQISAIGLFVGMVAIGASLGLCAAWIQYHQFKSSSEPNNTTPRNLEQVDQGSADHNGGDSDSDLPTSESFGPLELET